MRFVISDTFPPDACHLRSSCIVIDPLTGNFVPATAVWDTGASRSCISPSIATALSLPVVGSATNNTANGTTTSNTHVVDIGIGNVRFQKVAVSTPPLPFDGMVLIGMDLIGQGRFTVQNIDVNGEQKKVLTLEIP